MTNLSIFHEFPMRCRCETPEFKKYELLLVRYSLVICVLFLGEVGCFTPDSYCHGQDFVLRFSQQIDPSQLFRLIFNDRSKALQPVNNQNCLGVTDQSDSIILLKCSSDSTKWWRYGQLLINAKTRQCLSSTFDEDKPDDSLQVQPCDLENPEQAVKCGYPTNVGASTIGLEINKKLCEVESSSVNSLVYAKNRRGADQTWLVKSSDSDADHSGFCRETPILCKLPTAGTHSLIVSSNVELEKVSHISGSALQKYLGSNNKLCYEENEQVLIACERGYVDVLDSSNTHHQLTCTSLQKWSPAGLDCTRKTCVRPQLTGNESYTVIGEGFAYGDAIFYKCKERYKPQQIERICQAEGTWSGTPPSCELLCTENYTALHGTIMSPNYPYFYPASVECLWTLEAQPGWKISFWVRDFYMEYGFFSNSDCKHDVFMIRDSQSEKQYCGAIPLQKYVSERNKISIIFSSDETYSSRGFLLQYVMWDPDTRSEPAEPEISKFVMPENQRSDTSATSAEYWSYAISVIGTTLTIVLLGFVLYLLLSYFCYPMFENNEKSDEEDPETLRNIRLVRAKAIYGALTSNPVSKKQSQEDNTSLKGQLTPKKGVKFVEQSSEQLSVMEQHSLERAFEKFLQKSEELLNTNED